MLVWEPIRYADNGGVSIAYTVGGDGPVDLLFINGFVSHLEILAEVPLAQRFWERLGSFARIIWFDKRGMGVSDRGAGAYTLENVVDDALAVLDAVGTERVVVFGVSEGGSAATLLRAPATPTASGRWSSMGPTHAFPGRPTTRREFRSSFYVASTRGWSSIGQTRPRSTCGRRPSRGIPSCV